MIAPRQKQQQPGKRLRKEATEITEEHREKKVRREEGAEAFFLSYFPSLFPSICSVTSVSSVATTAV
jgi:hypothetical protein